MSSEKKRTSKLSYEILGLFVICLLLSVSLYFFFILSCYGVIDSYCGFRGIILSNEESYHLDNIIYSGALAACAIFFVVLFLILFGERLSYIRTIIKGVEALRLEEYGEPLPLQGKNELTELAQAVNEFSVARREIREKEGM